MVLLPSAEGYLIGSGNGSSGLGMVVQFATGEDGTLRMTITNEGTVIDTLARLKASDS